MRVIPPHILRSGIRLLLKPDSSAGVEKTAVKYEDEELLKPDSSAGLLAETGLRTGEIFAETRLECGHPAIIANSYLGNSS